MKANVKKELKRTMCCLLTAGMIGGMVIPAQAAENAGINVASEESVSRTYTAEDPFVFPSDVDVSVTLEAEFMELHNTGKDEKYPMEISPATWANNGKFVNAMNPGDSIVLYYNAPKAGVYNVTVTYRSGAAANGFSWSEELGKIENGSATIGATDAAAETHTGTFQLNVKEAGSGKLTFLAGSAGAPQLDKFDVVYTGLNKFNDKSVLMNNALANSYHNSGNDGPASYAFNDNTENWWHSNYGAVTDANKNGAASASNPIWIQTGFDKVWRVKEIEYTARTNPAGNNCISDYKVYVAKLDDPTETPTDEDFGYPNSPALEGSFGGNCQGKHTIDFGNLVEVTHVRIAATSSTTDNGYITASNISFIGKGVESEVEEAILTRITLTPPDKTEYRVLDELDTTGLVVSGIYNDGSTQTITEGYSVSGYQKGTVGEQRITVTYDGKTAEFVINVVADYTYTVEDSYSFPSTIGESNILEAECLELHNTGNGEDWPLQIKEADWASGNLFVNSMNSNDYAVLYYDAPETGIYSVKVTYRSGAKANGFSWSEESGNIADGSVTIGSSDSSQTRTATFHLNVLKAGKGKVTFLAGNNGAPQLDKFEIVNKTDLKKFSDADVLTKNAKANSYHNKGADGPASYAFNGSTADWWHSNYGTATDTNVNGRVSVNNPVWIQSGFDTKWQVKEIWYKGRTDTTHNWTKDYKVYVANLEDPTADPTEDDFDYPQSPVVSGTFSGNGDYVIDFGRFVEATHVRIVTTSATGQEAENYVTASSIDFVGREVPTPVEYTVTFDRQNGEEVTTQTVAENTELTLSETETPVREGYVFTGWYTDAECTEACGDTITVTADLTIYAGWTADKTALESAIAAAEAVERENYTEESWNRFTVALEKAQEVKQDAAATAEAVSSAAKELTEAMEQLEVVTTFAVAVTAENGTVTVNVPEGKTANALDAYDEVTVTAEAAEGYEFVYWMDKDTKVVLSKNAEYTFVVVKNTNLEAVFAEKESEAVVVTFMTGDEFANQFVAAVTAEDGTVQLPEAKEYAGYEFAGWDTNGDGIAEIASDETSANVTESATWIAVYTTKETYAVTVTNGEIISGKQEDGSYELGSKLGVKAVKPEDAEGTFSGWYVGDTLVSTNETYWFVVNAETALEARWSEAAVVVAEPVVRFSKTNRTTEASGKQKVEIALSWSAPKEGCTVLAEGILRTYKTGLEEQLTLGTTVSGITTNQCKSVGQNGTFTLTVNLGATSANRTKDITVRGYVRYMDANGEIHVAYTESQVIAAPQQ